MMDRTSVRRNGRRRQLRALAVLSAAAAVTCQAGAQQAAPAEVVASLRVDADERCATTDTLIARVHARSARIRFDAQDENIARLVVRIDEGPGGDFAAALFVYWPGGQRAERRLTAQSCASALDALALLVAMTLDPGTRPDARASGQAGEGESSVRTTGPGAGRAATAQRAPRATPAPNEGASAPAEEATQTAPTDAGTPTAEARSPGPRGQADAADPTPDAPAAFGVEHAVLGAHARLWSGPTPAAMYGIGAHAALVFHGTGLWTPALQLQVSHAWLNEVSETGGNADFALDSAQLDACPVGLRLSSLTARVCATGTIGRLTARGYDSYTPQKHAKLWASIGGAALVTVGLGEWLELQGGFGLTAPILRYAFAFRPEVFYRVPDLCLAGHLGAGVRFP